MGFRFLITAFLAIATLRASAIDHGTCPPGLPPIGSIRENPRIPESPNADVKYAGTVYVLTVISDTGYVCSARAVKGPNKELKKRAEDTIRKWQFRPGTKSGHSVATVATVTVTFWMNRQGEIVTPSMEQQSHPDK
jgi:TonB family protein